ncbi:MAG: HAD family hydrolase [Candidatus Levybacteria bacterium]|nr:HAD family hydrolase [Candidatus Levybacteria bacterium]
MNNKISTIFFDIDNTLLKHTYAEKKAIYTIKNKYFKKNSLEEFENIWIEMTKKNWLLYEQNKLTFEKQRIQRVIDVWEALEKEISEKSAMKIFEEYLAFYEDLWKLFPHVYTVLQEIYKRGISIGIITNGNKKQQIKKLQKTKIYPFIRKDLLIISEEIGQAKPQKEIFTHSQAMARANPENILFVGDNFIQDIEPAMKLNWNTALADYSHSSRSKNAINDFRRLLDFIK